MNRDERLARILLHVVRRRSISTSEAAASCGVASRVARDDLAHLHRSEILEVVGAGRRRRYVLHSRVAEENLGLRDRISLQVGRDATRFLETSPLEVGGAATSDRVRVLPEPAREYGVQGEIVDRCLQALFTDRTLDIRYEGRNGSDAWRGFQPLLLVVYRRALYLVGGAGRRVYTLAVDRMLEVEPGEPFVRPTDWDADAWLADRFGITAAPDELPNDVVLEFSAQVAHLVRSRRWHPTERVETLRDGRVRLSMRTRGAELIRFALEWGPHCRVLAPPTLRERVVDELRRALAAYDDEGAP